MYQKYIVLILLWACISAHHIDPSYARGLEREATANASDSLQTSNKTLHVVPYLGSSTLVGNLGVELQYRKWGYNIIQW